jgi:small subunit ribosomal protein S20
VIEYLNEMAYKGVNYLPNIKSSIQSVKTDAERRAKNVAVKSTVKTAFRKVNDAVKAGNAEEAKSFLSAACKKIDKAAADNIFHKNTAARRKSRLANKVNALSK